MTARQIPLLLSLLSLTLAWSCAQGEPTPPIAAASVPEEVLKVDTEGLIEGSQLYVESYSKGWVGGIEPFEFDHTGDVIVACDDGKMALVRVTSNVHSQTRAGKPFSFEVIASIVVKNGNELYPVMLLANGVPIYDGDSYRLDFATWSKIAL